MQPGHRFVGDHHRTGTPETPRQDFTRQNLTRSPQQVGADEDIVTALAEFDPHRLDGLPVHDASRMSATGWPHQDSNASMTRSAVASGGPSRESTAMSASAYIGARSTSSRSDRKSTRLNSSLM